MDVRRPTAGTIIAMPQVSAIGPARISSHVAWAPHRPMCVRVSSCRPCAVDGVNPTADIRGVRTAEEGDQRGHLLWLAVTAHRDVLDELLTRRLRIGPVDPRLERPHHPRLDRRRADR